MDNIFSCGGMFVEEPLKVDGKVLKIDETRVQAIENSVGELADLTTDHKSDIVSAINEMNVREITEEGIYTGFTYNGKPIYKQILNSTYVGSITDTGDWVDIGLTIPNLDDIVTIQLVGQMRGRLDYYISKDPDTQIGNITVHSTHGAINFGGDTNFVVEYTLIG